METKADANTTTTAAFMKSKKPSSKNFCSLLREIGKQY